MFIYISKLNKNIEFSEFDNPIRFALEADYDVSKIKHYGLDFIETSKRGVVLKAKAGNVSLED